MDYCKFCANKELCNTNYWCITMDAQRKINNEYVCDNFELLGRTYNNTKYELHSCENTIKSLQKIKEFQQKIIEMMAEDLSQYTIFQYAKDTGLMIGNYLNTTTTNIKEYYLNKARMWQNNNEYI